MLLQESNRSQVLQIQRESIYLPSEEESGSELAWNEVAAQPTLCLDLEQSDLASDACDECSSCPRGWLTPGGARRPPEITTPLKTARQAHTGAMDILQTGPVAGCCVRQQVCVNDVARTTSRQSKGRV